MSDTCTAFSVVPPGFEEEADNTLCPETVEHVVITKCDCHPNLYLCNTHFGLYMDRGWVTQPYLGVTDDTPTSIAALEAEIRGT